LGPAAVTTAFTRLDAVVWAVALGCGAAIALMLAIGPRGPGAGGPLAPGGVLYLSPASDSPEIWRAPLPGESGSPQQLSRTGGRIFDYSVSPDGTHIVYARINDQAGIDLWLQSSAGGDPVLLVPCGPDRCTGSDWSPDGGRVAYSREEVGAGANARPGPPRLWTVSIGSGETAPLFQDSQILGYSPSWSPDGGRLAAFDGNVGGIRVLDIRTGGQQVLESQLGQVGEWSPDGSRMLFGVMRLAAEGTYVEVLLADLVTRELTVAIGAEAGYADAGIPAWSPDGQWIVVGVRRGPNSPARELWLMRPDGSEASAVANEAGFTYGGYSWDPGGTMVVFQRFPLGTAEARPEVLVWDRDRQSTQLVAQDAWLARWLPEG
jgi:Tol biopolymer transport system component